MSESAFKMLVDVVTSQPDKDSINASGLWGNTKRPITVPALEEFHKQWIIDVLRGWRYGQSFSEFFGISDASPLYWFSDADICQRWIKANYFNGKLDWPTHMVVNDR